MEKYLRLLAGNTDWKRLKRKLMIGLGAMAVLFVLGTIGLGYAIYRLVGAGTQAVETALSDSDPSLPNNAAVRLVDNLLAAAIRQGDTSSVKNGLLCLEAIGGPSPEKALEHITKRSEDSQVAAEAERLLDEMRGTEKDKDKTSLSSEETQRASAADACFNVLVS